MNVETEENKFRHKAAGCRTISQSYWKHFVRKITWKVL